MLSKIHGQIPKWIFDMEKSSLLSLRSKVQQVAKITLDSTTYSIWRWLEVTNLRPLKVLQELKNH